LFDRTAAARWLTVAAARRAGRCVTSRTSAGGILTLLKLEQGGADSEAAGSALLAAKAARRRTAGDLNRSTVPAPQVQRSGRAMASFFPTPRRLLMAEGADLRCALDAGMRAGG